MKEFEYFTFTRKYLSHIIDYANKNDVEIISVVVRQIPERTLGAEPPMYEAVLRRKVVQKIDVSKLTLRDFGYADGGYLGTCRVCKQKMYMVDKRAWCCKDCATKAFEEYVAARKATDGSEV